MLMEESVQMALVLTESVQTAEVIWSFALALLAVEQHGQRDL
jgi:hypothetical protein